VSVPSEYAIVSFADPLIFLYLWIFNVDVVGMIATFFVMIRWMIIVIFLLPVEVCDL